MPQTPLVLLAGGFSLIVAGSTLFTRSLERTVLRFFNNKSRGLRILGNLSLSLPELLLPLIAFLTPGSGKSRVEAGTGALFGPPLFLLLFLVPLAFFLKPRENRILAREIPLLLSGLALALFLFGHSLLFRLPLALFLAGIYLWGLLSTPEDEAPQEVPEPGSPWGPFDAISVVGGSLLMGGGSQLFRSGSITSGPPKGSPHSGPPSFWPPWPRKPPNFSHSSTFSKSEACRRAIRSCGAPSIFRRRCRSPWGFWPLPGRARRPPARPERVSF